MNSPKKNGSALLVTLLVTSLLLALVLTFTARVRLELRQVQTRIETQQARKNARLSLELAIGQLQTVSGLDQRATARADILGPGVSGPSRLWTGVWTRNPNGGVSASPAWLVSGSSPDPLDSVGTNDIQLFPALGSADPVRAPLQEILNPQNQTMGVYAYWVSDEASKASLHARRNHLTLYNTPALSGQRRNVESIHDFGINLKPFFTNIRISLTESDWIQTLEKAFSSSSLTYVSDQDGQSLNPVNPSIVHDLTLRSLGVLENSADGGLKRNLADSGFRDGFLATDDTAKFLGPKNGVLPVEHGLPADRGILPGAPFFSPRPLLTEAVLYVGLFHTWSDAKLRIRYHLQAEYLNPYTLPLEFPRDGDSQYDRALVMLFQNLPTITVEDTTPGSSTPTITENLNELVSYPPTDHRRDLNSWMEILPTDQPNVPQLKAGEIYQVMEPNPILQERGLARDFGTTRWSASANTRPANNAQIRISATHPADGVVLKGVPYNGVTGTYRSRPVYFQWDNLGFDDFSITKTFNEGPNPFSRPTSSGYNIDDYIFAYHFRLYSDETDPNSLRDILTGMHLLDPDHRGDRSFIDLDGATRTHAELLDPISADPPAIVTDTINLFSKLDVFMDGTSRSHDEDYRAMYLIDVPDGDAISIGQLTHLPLYRQPIWLIGSPGGGEYNKVFDRYYLSPKRNHPVTGSPYLLSPALTPIAPPANQASHTDAATELIDGSFNLNSTSEAAWFSVLSAPVLSPSASDEAATGDQERYGSFFRLPRFQSAQNTFAVTQDELESPSTAFAQGIRSLHTETSLTHLRQVASEIVQALQARGRPFADLESFVNSGILQQAIDSVPEINQGLFERSNIFLKQQDLLTKLSPVLRPRSDTFVIRAYGSVQSSAGAAPTSQAACEAIVQRLPGKVDGSDPMTPADQLANHRPYRIISFRWLSDEEL